MPFSFSQLLWGNGLEIEMEGMMHAVPTAHMQPFVPEVVSGAYSHSTTRLMD
jgi:hypothetical protein